MIEDTNGAGSLRESLQSFIIICVRRWENLHGDISSQPRVARSIDFAHSTRAKGRRDFVWSQSGGGSDAHSGVFQTSSGKTS